MKIWRSTDSPSWPDLVADCQIKIGTNEFGDMVRKGRIVCRMHREQDPPHDLTAYWAELTLPELARFARLHAEIVGVLGDKDATRDLGGGGAGGGAGGGGADPAASEQA